MDTERAYELASQGVVRAATESSPIIYSVKCIKFDLPHFDLGIAYYLQISFSQGLTNFTNITLAFL